MKKILVLIVFLLILPTVIAETFTWRLGNLDEIKGGSHTIGFTESCDLGSKIGRELGRLGNTLGNVYDKAEDTVKKIFGFAVSNAIFGGASKNTFSYSFPDSDIYSVNFWARQSNDGCGQSLKIVLNGNDSQAPYINQQGLSRFDDKILFLGGANLNGAYFERTGGTNCYSPGFAKRETACNIEVTNLKLFAFDKNSVKGSTRIFLKDETNRKNTPLDLGRVGTLLKNMNGEVFISSDNPKVLIWVDDHKKSTINPDDHAYACLDDDKNGVCDYKQADIECAAGSDWYKGACCGVSISKAKSYGIGYHSDVKAICGKKSNEWQWASLEDTGKIYDLTEPNILVVSDGNNYFECGGSIPSWLTNVQALNANKLFQSTPSEKHEYYCNRGKRILAECAGEYPKFSKDNSFNTGAKINLNQTPEKNVYCASDGSWTEDLDAKDVKTCESAGFAWTGSKCCGEPEDEHEYYNDPGNKPTSGGCWDSSYVQRGSLTSDKKILNHNGEFYGCKITSQKLSITQKNECSVIEDSSLDNPPKHYVCQTSNEWQKVDEKGNRIITSAVWYVDTSKGQTQNGCCLSTECWDGESCVKRGVKYEDKSTGQKYICQ